MGDFDQISMRCHYSTTLEGGVPGDSVVGDCMAMNGASWWTTFGDGAMVISQNLLCSVFFYAAMSVVNHKPP